MPADLFRPNVAATPSRRRASLLPVSIALHAIAIAAFFIVPLLADVELPPPNQRVAAPYIPVLPIAPPIRVHSKPTTKAVANTEPVAPLVAPPTITPEVEIAHLGSPVPGTDIGFIDGVDPGPMIAGEAPPPAPPSPPAPRVPVKVGGVIQAPRKIVNVAPVYPTIAQTSRVQGTVMLEALIGIDGRVEKVRVLQPAPLLTDAAVTAVRQWVFTPTKLNGEPVQVIMTVTVDFKMQ